jgi:hypothetical protein
VLDQVRGAIRRWRGVTVGEERRYNVATQDRWRPRAEAAVQIALDGGAKGDPSGTPVRVSDFGAGNELVGRLLAERAPYPVSYHAYDLHPQQPSTTQLDVRDGLPGEHSSIAFALGLIEYIPESDPILDRLATHADYVVLSYVEIDETRTPLSRRESLGWVRHQTGTQLDEALAHSGLEELARGSSDSGETTIRLLRSSAPAPADRSSA